MTDSNLHITYRLKDKQLHRSMTWMNVDFEEALARGFHEAKRTSHDYATVNCYPSARLTRKGAKDWDEKTRQALGIKTPKQTYFFRVSEIEEIKEKPNAQE